MLNIFALGPCLAVSTLGLIYNVPDCGIETCIYTFLHFTGKPSKNKHIHMKIIDDQLRIIDEVPTSAVEMQVKEKVCKIFLSHPICTQ